MANIGHLKKCKTDAEKKTKRDVIDTRAGETIPAIDVSMYSTLPVKDVSRDIESRKRLKDEYEEFMAKQSLPEASTIMQMEYQRKAYQIASASLLTESSTTRRIKDIYSDAEQTSRMLKLNRLAANRHRRRASHPSTSTTARMSGIRSHLKYDPSAKASNIRNKVSTPSSSILTSLAPSIRKGPEISKITKIPRLTVTGVGETIPATAVSPSSPLMFKDMSRDIEPTSSLDVYKKKCLADQQLASASHLTASTTRKGQSQSDMLADVGDIQKEMGVNEKGYDCKSTDFTITEDHDSKRGIDFYLNHQKVKISKSIPTEILDSLEMLCGKYSVKFATFAQDPDDWQHILILGNKAENIPETEVAIAIKNTHFKVTQQNSNGPLHTELCSLSIKKKTWTNNSWTPEEAASCELLVSAQERNRDRPRSEGSSYSIGPAHMVLRDKTARSLFAQPNRVQDARIEVESRSTSNRYLIQVDDEETDIFDLNHPVLMSYRYWCSKNPECDLCKYLNGGAGDVDDIRLCRHMIINDIVFLPLERPSADRLQNQLNHIFNFEIGQVVPINTIGQLRNLGEGNLPIKVGNAEGHLVPHMPEARNRRSFIGYHLQFVLHTRNEEGNIHTLEAGDCGRIVFCEGEKRNQYRPLGMFIGRFKGSFQTPVYQAILLKEAFNDIENEYAHHVREVNLYQHQ